MPLTALPTVRIRRVLETPPSATAPTAREGSPPLTKAFRLVAATAGRVLRLRLRAFLQALPRTRRPTAGTLRRVRVPRVLSRTEATSLAVPVLGGSKTPTRLFRVPVSVRR